MKKIYVDLASDFKEITIIGMKGKKFDKDKRDKQARNLFEFLVNKLPAGTYETIIELSIFYSENYMTKYHSLQELCDAYFAFKEEKIK